MAKSTCALLFSCLFAVVSCQEHPAEFNFNVSSYSVSLVLHSNISQPIIEGDVVWLNFDCHVSDESQDGHNNVTVEFYIKDPSIAKIIHSNSTKVLPGSVVAHQLQIEGLFLGRTVLQVRLHTPGPNGTLTADFRYDIAVKRRHRPVDTIFIIMVSVMVCIANIGMGCKVELQVIKEVLKKPIAPIIGFTCQFLIMPVVSISCYK